jgi:hypothetical protein
MNTVCRLCINVHMHIASTMYSRLKFEHSALLSIQLYIRVLRVQTMYACLYILKQRQNWLHGLLLCLQMFLGMSVFSVVWLSLCGPALLSFIAVPAFAELYATTPRSVSVHTCNSKTNTHCCSKTKRCSIILLVYYSDAVCDA